MESDFPTKEDFDRLKKKYEQSEKDVARMEEVLCYVREGGHPFVDIREVECPLGWRTVYFCILCLEPCTDETWLFDHINDHSHIGLQVTFFHDHTEQSKSLPASDKGKGKLLDTHNTAADSLAKVKSSNLGPVASSLKSDGDKTGGILVIPGVLQNDNASDLVGRHIGVGKIGARLLEKDGVSSGTCRIWCEWLGNVDSTTEEVPKHDFAIVTYSYTDNLWLKAAARNFQEQICDICNYKFLPNKDVAALLNRKTGKLVCSTRNFSGIFHVYHVSCLIQWILFFEVGSFSKIWIPTTANETKAKNELTRHSVVHAKAMV